MDPVLAVCVREPPSWTQVGDLLTARSANRFLIILKPSNPLTVKIAYKERREKERILRKATDFVFPTKEKQTVLDSFPFDPLSPLYGPPF
jgi:hypothetical protein